MSGNSMVEGLRVWADDCGEGLDGPRRKAADEIERLRAEVERLCRCNEQINKTMSEIITRQAFEILRLKGSEGIAVKENDNGF